MLVIEITAAEAGAGLEAIVDGVCMTREPVQITGERGMAVLICEDDWRAVQETLHLASIPNMADSLIEGVKTPVCECDSDPGW